VTRRERDYSHRTLLDKLGVRAGHRVGLVGPHDGAFLDELARRLETPPVANPRSRCDLVFLRIDAPGDVARIGRCAQRIVSGGALWILHPKGKGAAPNDAQVRAAGLAAGLVDNKISAYSATHTATRYVVPVARRPSWA
jgi:hypothetical protein